MQRMFFLLAFFITVASFSDAATKIIVEAGDYDRENCIVTIPIKPDPKLEYQLLRGADGKSILTQVELKGLPSSAGATVSFVLPKLAKGSKAIYELASGTFAGQSVEARRDGKKLKISYGQQALLEYQAEAGQLPRDDIREVFTRGGYIHPIYSPSGKVVTDDFPPNHIHHHGVWWSWTKTDFQERHPDFWNMGDGKGRVEFVSLGETRSGPVYASFSAKHRFVDLTAPTPVVALNEIWEVKIYSTYNSFKTKQGWLFDVVSTQECATNAPLKLPEYRYGGIGVRGNRAWNGKGKADWLTSEGEVTSDQGMRGRWCDISGLIDGSHAGMTILCHPSNFRALQPMRIHPTEPFFCFAPQEAGDMEIAPGTKYISRYRFIVHDGEPDRQFIESVWNDYANPPKVTVSDE